MFRSLALFLSVSIAAGISYAGNDQKAAAFVLCKNQKSVRTIRVMPEQKEDKTCTITYAKNGVEEVIGSNRAMGTCKSILQSIKFNLQSASWNCRDVATATVSSSSEASTQ